MYFLGNYFLSGSAVTAYQNGSVAGSDYGYQLPDLRYLAGITKECRVIQISSEICKFLGLSIVFLIKALYEFVPGRSHGKVVHDSDHETQLVFIIIYGG